MSTTRRCLALCVAALCVAALPTGAALGQVPIDTTPVVTQLAGPSILTQVVFVDAAGAAVTLGRFPSDTMPPLAVAIDPYDRELLVALDLGGGQSRVVRLLPVGTQLGGEIVLGDLPGPCTQLTVLLDEVVAVVGGPSGGIYALPRRSNGSATQLVARPEAAALHVFDVSQPFAVLAWNDDPTTVATDAGAGYLDLGLGFYYGPFSFAPPTAAPITGVADLPTGAPRQALSFADGTFAVWLTSGAAPQPVATSPPVPAGGAAAMHSEGGGFALQAVGGAAFPFLYRVDAGTGAVNVVSTALPGDPVDFAIPASAAAVVRPFGAACAIPDFSLVSSPGTPQPGNMAFGVDTTGARPLQPLFFVAGFSDVRSTSTVLPVPLPGGCPLQVDPLAVRFAIPDASGAARLPLPIPNLPGLVGTMVFAQALQDAGFVPGLGASTALAIRVGL